MSILLKRGNTAVAYPDAPTVREALLALARELAANGQRDAVEVLFDEGHHSLRVPFRLSAVEEPALSALDITLSGNAATVSSLLPILEKPQKSNGYFTYQLKKEENGDFPIFRELFLDGIRVPTSVSPTWKNTDVLTEDERTGKVKREGFYVPIEIAKQLVSAPIGGTELMVYILWIYASFHVQEVDFAKTRTKDGETYVLVKPYADEMAQFCHICARHVNIGAGKLHFRNSPAFLTRESFAYDQKSGTLYLADEDSVSHTVEYPSLETLFEIDGVDGVTVKGIRFTGVTDKYHKKNMVYTHPVTYYLCCF